jgi:hypothetical protein
MSNDDKVIPFLLGTNGHGTETPAQPVIGVAYDLDGRRRVVFSTDEQRKIDHVLTLLVRAGFGIAVGCHSRPDSTEPCGQVLLNEGAGTPDAGYGCRCQRIHFVK